MNVVASSRVHLVALVWLLLRAITASRWERGLCGAPDVPHALSKGSATADPSGDQCVGLSFISHPVKLIEGHSTMSPRDKENDAGSTGNGPLLITFQVRDSRALWEAVLVNGNLLLTIPDEGLPEGTKQAITELLEFAEEQLHASAVIVSLNKQRTDRATIIRTLMYLGFESLAPGNQLVAPEMQDPQMYFMAYMI